MKTIRLRVTFEYDAPLLYPDDEDGRGSNQFFYEEHSCVLNRLREALAAEPPGVCNLCEHSKVEIIPDREET